MNPPTMLQYHIQSLPSLQSTLVLAIRLALVLFAVGDVPRLIGVDIVCHALEVRKTLALAACLHLLSVVFWMLQF